MTDTETSAPRNLLEDLPLYHLLFPKQRDGGGAAKVAPGVAEMHGITLDELKPLCRVAAEELITERGHLLVYAEPVLD